MKTASHRFWGLMMLLASCTMPWSVRAVPNVSLLQNESGSGDEETIVCFDCNPLIFGKPLDINRASMDHLRSLPHIGEKRAMDIVSHRTRFGDFEKVEDLDDVRGIGPKTLMRVQPYIVTE